MKVVLDTNVFIDAFFSADDDCILILKEENRGEFTLIMSQEMLNELTYIIDKSVKEFDMTGSETMIVLKFLHKALLRTELIEPKRKFSKCEDSSDNKFFECAIEGNANYIVSRDAHLHKIKDEVKLVNSQNEEIKVLYPDEFILEISKFKLVANFNNK